ncbi:MAG: putative bifunctional diguanylate cyclase/phosphodiesterase [Desulfobulbus sp.]
MDAPVPPLQFVLLRIGGEICRLLLREENPAAALQGVCDHLVTIPESQAALLVLVDQAAGQVALAETGMARDHELLLSRIREGRLPECGLRALEGEVVLCDQEVCGLCPEAGGGSGGNFLSAPLWRFSGRVGFMLLSFTTLPRMDQDLRGAIMGLAQTIGDGLNHLFARESARIRLQELERMDERVRLALEAADAELWEWDILAGIMHTSLGRREQLDYRSDHSSVPNTVSREIHPDDRNHSLAVLANHLAGKTREYRIAYRVSDQDGAWQWFLDRGRVTERDENGMPLRMAGTHQDITRQKEQEAAVAEVRRQLHRALQRERNFLQAVIDGASNPILVIDFNHTVLLINRAAARLFARDGSTEDMRGAQCYQLRGGDAPCTDSRFPCPVAQMREQRQQTKLLHNPYHGNRINNTFELEISPLADQNGRIYAVIEVGRDITDRLRIEHELRASQSHFYRLAHRDALTGLPNRLLFADRCTQVLNKARRDRREVALLFLDLDYFKQINDTLGHDVGDVLLVEVAQRLQAQCRQSDTVARLGGDEFVFLLDGVAGREGATVVVDKIMAAVREPVMAKGHRLQVGASIGGALFPEDARTRDELIKCADMALYAAKEAGRNTSCWYRQDLQPSERTACSDGDFLCAALDEGRLSIDYLPWLSLPEERVAGLEARLWWRHPVTGLVQADNFLKLAEEGGFLDRLSLWMLARILEDRRGWPEQVQQGTSILFPVNGSLLLDADWLEQAADLARTDSPGMGPLLLGLRARDLAEATAPMLAGLERARESGFGLAVTECGDGSLSLGRLEYLDAQLLTLDPSLVAGLPGQRRSCRLVSGLVGLGRALESPVLACGVTDARQRDFLRQSGCSLFQGPLVMRAIKAGEVAALLENRVLVG